MSRLLEILGRAIAVDTADLIWHWFDAVDLSRDGDSSTQFHELNKVIELMADRRTDSATEQLRLYLFENPSCIYGHLAAAAIYITENQLQKAIEELNSVYMRRPSNTMALYALGHCYERLGKESQAIEFYQDCLKFKNYLQLPRERMAAIYFKNTQLEKTIFEYELLKKEYPDDMATLVTLGHLYIAAEQHDIAAETFNTAILIHPDNYHDVDDEIESYIAQGELYQALDEINNLLAHQDTRPDLLIRRADILHMIGDEEQSAVHYEQALNICPDFLEATIKLGTQYLLLNDYSLAAQQFNRATEINDRIVDAYIGLAITQKLAKNHSEASTTLSLAAAIAANSPLLFTQTAILQFRMAVEDNSDPSQSANIIEHVINAHIRQIVAHPRNPDLYYRLGVLMLGVAKPEEAIEAFRTVLQINPTYHRAESKLAITLFETGEKQLALEQLKGPDCSDKDVLELHYKTALLYCDRLRFASSLINLENNLEANYACSDAAVNISIVLQNLGLLDRAAIMWENLSETANQAINTNYDYPPSQDKF